MLPNRVFGQLQKEEVPHFVRENQFDFMWQVCITRSRERAWLSLYAWHSAQGSDHWPGGGGGRSAFAHTKLQLVCLLSARWPLLAERRVGLFFPFLTLRAAPVHLSVQVFQSAALMCVWDVILMCEVFCGSQQNEDGLCCREDCSRGARKEGESWGGREGHWCVSSSDRWQKSSVCMATHVGTCLPSVCTPACCFFFLLSVSDNRECLVSDLRALWDEGGNDSVNMRIFSPGLNHHEITLFTPHFSLIIHWFTAKWCVQGLIRVALAEFFTNL